MLDGDTDGLDVKEGVRLGVRVFVGVTEDVAVPLFVVEGVELVLEVGVGLEDGHRSFSQM